MSNPLKTIGHGIEVAAIDAARIIAWPFTHAAKFAKILGEALSDEPAVKTATVQLVTLAEAVIKDGGLDYETKGLNIVNDMQTVADIKAFFTYFEATFLPAVEKAYKAIEADAKATDTATTTDAPST